MKRDDRLQFYLGVDGWHWRVRASNGRIVADSGQGYSRLADCKRGAAIAHAALSAALAPEPPL